MSNNSAPLSVTVDEAEPGTHLVLLAGEFDMSTAESVVDALCAVAGSTVIADISGVTFMDSSGIGQLVRAKLAIEQSGSRLVVRGANPMIQRTFDITGLEEMLTES